MSFDTTGEYSSRTPSGYVKGNFLRLFSKPRSLARDRPLRSTSLRHRGVATLTLTGRDAGAPTLKVRAL
jgi:hypothetical protein